MAEGSAERREGGFCLCAMVHTLAYPADDGPRQTVPWDGSSGGGPFSYASRPCAADAPVNDRSSDLPALGGLLGGRVPASTRTHPLQFEVSGPRSAPALRGTLTLVVCRLGPGPTDDGVEDADRPRVEVTWRGHAERCGASLVTFRGTFAIVGGTGPYRRLRGDGDLGGYLYSSEEALAGALEDGQYALVGRYRIPAGSASVSHPLTAAQQAPLVAG